ncbi:alaS protein [Lactobacillus selangorensis]|uniref:Alanine--tRNA ligase n=1 Tax=Lactobacillus selangorensis TaxID=81857 RepID=A0A0R2FQY4_9LACO|nr:alanine--tRNA ligase [Lactobacillus selangorensis]KRN27452.1 alaS protein [Lactobacillus selangorensis]KRN31351.1 alaS protein [Lactobacillus selangorensis]
MKKLSSSQVRQMFLDFFHEKGHDIEPSASLVPQDDPTLLWINSGVATMKKYFDGTVVPTNPRITSAQKSIRTNDIENVGKTARHHTFFEMLGNFSVGDYFKEQAIPWAWEFLTSPKWLGFDPKKLYVTVYPKDTEAHRIWHEVVGVPEDHIYEAEDNFWDIGQGPCGPDSEIFYDRGQHHNNVSEDDPENYPGGENERYLEIWNIVFSEFNHLPDGRYVDQPHKNIDTGMGLERIVSIIQDAPTNFETDLFMPIIHATEKMSAGKVYGQNAKDDESFKIIADHARAITFAIGDGALPSNEGRGYVIRRLIRRAALNGKQLGIDHPFLYQLVPVVGEIMKSAYPDVLAQKDYIAKVIESEEKRFGVTLDDGVTLLNQIIAATKDKGQTVISGTDAFKLFDTYGFPVELTAEYAADDGLTVDMDGFNKEMDQQKNRARQARSNAQSMGSQDETLMSIDTPSKFTGYDELVDKQSILDDIVVDDQLLDSVDHGTAQLIFTETPFYAEMGGQVADKGEIRNEQDQVVAVVTDVQHAPNGQNLHTVDVKGELKKGATYTLSVDPAFRHGVMRNHTATHLLDQALRNVLGEHTHQAGSLVEPDYLRFDFTSFSPVTQEQLNQVEQIVNDQIWKEIPVTTVVTDIETAKKMGAIAMFKEKYGDEVRVVSIGDYNREFCGGTHVKNTAQIGLFKIESETGVGAGVRRIEAVTSKQAFDYLNKQDHAMHQMATDLKAAKVEDVPSKVSQLKQQLHAAEKENESLQAKIASQQANTVFQNVQDINGTTLVAEQVKVAGMNELRQLADQWKSQDISDVLVLGTVVGEKVNLIVSVKPETVKKGIKAGDLIKAIAPLVGGGGGGRPDMAQAGGKKPAGLPDALKEAASWLAQH